MKRRPKPEPVLAEGERPPCGFQWKTDAEDGHVFAAGCACGLSDFEHQRYRSAMRSTILAEREENGMRQVVEQALAAAIPVRQRMRIRTGTLVENGRKRRYVLDDRRSTSKNPATRERLLLMANIGILNVDLANPARPVVHLSATPSALWRAAFNAYVEWAKGGPTPPNVPPETHFSVVVLQSDFDLAADRINIRLRPSGSSYEDVRAFVEAAVVYANGESP